MSGGTRDDGETESLLEEGRQGESQGPGHPYIETRRDLAEKCLSCLGGRFAVVFDDEDKDVLWYLRNRIVNKPKPKDEDLHALCLDVWNAAFPTEQRTVFETGTHWQCLGFQGKDPCTDVRTGAWPAEQLASFARHHSAKFRDMVREAGNPGTSGYLIAIVSFNVSHMISMFFDLVDVPSAPPLPNVQRATRQQLKHLTSLIISESHANHAQVNADMCARVLNEVFVEVMSVVHKSWMELTASAAPGTVTVMQFPNALRQGFDANDRFWKSSCQNLDKLKIEC